jgi:hypothetical protein
MMKLKRCVIALIVLPTGGCTLFSPYVPSAKIESSVSECTPGFTTQDSQTIGPSEASDGGKKTITTKTITTTRTVNFKCNSSTLKLSNKLKEHFQSSAASLSRTSNSTTIAIAGLLGLGAYKGITDGGKSQIAALATGAGTLYGAHSAMYTPTREQLFQRGVKALNCLDGFYADITPEIGEQLAEHYKATRADAWPVYEERYETAFEIAVFHANSYRDRVLGVAADLNILLSNAQPTPAESNAKIASAIYNSIPDIGENGSTGQKLLNVRQQSQVAAIFPKLERWVKRIEFADNRISKSNPDSCNLQGVPVIRILGIENQGSVTMEPGTTSTHAITNASSLLTSGVYPTGSEADKQAVSAMLISEGGNFAIRLEAKSATEKPVVIKITDNGNGGLSTSFMLDVKAPGDKPGDQDEEVHEQEPEEPEPEKPDQPQETTQQAPH